MRDIESTAPPQQNPPLLPPSAAGGSRRSTPAGRRPGPLRFVVDSVRMAWRWLTRMRTALYLLAALAVQSALATVVPQAPNVPGTVDAWRVGDEGPGVVVSRALDAFGAFDVYGSTLFLAFLLLMYLSLTACLIPRIRAWVRLVRRSQPPLLRVTPADADVATFTTAHPPEVVLDEVERHLAEPRGGLRRWRIRRSDEGAPQIAAESGLWSREGGSLAFHLSFYVLLAAIVFGQLLTFEGQRGVIEGEPGFTDTAVSYWMYAPGRWFPEERHAGWQLDLEEFEVDWIRDPLAPGAGQPMLFRSAVSITGRDGSVERGIVEGNRPLVVDGRKIHQLDWGYAPRIVVRQDGAVVHDGWANTQANTQGLFTGAIKVPSATPDVGLELFLYPFAPEGPEGPRLTGAPWADAPLLFVLQWRGDLQLGLTQQFINELDVSALDLEGGATLRPGERVQLGDVEVEFVELRRWVGFQVSSRPQVPWLLAGSAMLSVGLIAALYAYRRRLWVLVEEAPSEAAPSEEGSAAGTRTLVTVIGRAFQRPDAATEEHARIVAELTERLSRLESGRPSGQPQHEGAHP